MKRLFSLAVALAACVCAHAVWFSSAPGSVDSGQSYWVSADESTYSYDTEIYLYKNGSFFAYGNGWGYASAGNSTTDYGAQTVTYEAYSSWYDDWWNSYGDYTSTSVSITQPNNAPSISWHVSPSWVPVGENYYVQVRGYDPDGNLYGVSVWKNGVPYALNGGQNTTEMYSDVNWLAEGSPQQITFSAQAYDNSGAQSEIIYHTVNIYVPNVAPTVTWVNYPPQSAYINQSFAVQARGNDNNANLSWIYVWRDDQPFAFNGASGAEGYSDNNLATGTAPYPTTFKAMAGDTSGADSGFIYGTTSIINRNPTMTPTTITGPTVAWNSTYQHYTMWSGDPGISGSGNLTMASTIQDADANLVNHTLRYRQVTLNPNTWIQLGNNVPVTASTSTKQATLTTVETPGQWDFNAFGHDGWYSHPGESKTMWVYGSTNTAAFVSQAINGTALTGATPTISLNTGNNTATATILMRNTGSKPWQNPDSQFNTPHRLGAIGATPGAWGSSVRDMASAMVDPESFPGTNDTATFSFTFNIPQTPGNYVFQWKMLEQGVAGDPFFETATPAVTVTVIDTTPPIPSVLQLVAKTHNSVSLSWTAATDNSGSIAGYNLYRNGSLVQTLGNVLSFTDPGLTANTAYAYTVKARDAANNLSAASNQINVTTRLTPGQDQDGDGLPNEWEEDNSLNPFANDAESDPDHDGLTNIAEYNLGKNPNTYDQGTSTLGGAVPAGWTSLAAADGSIPMNIVVGATAGTLSVDKSGAATYSVPLWTTPGTAGMQPQLSLNYSSQGGAGIAGLGWSLGGASAISRGPQTLAIDGQNRGLTLTASDRFYLDGQRLIYVGGGTGYGTPGSEYRTELESFTKVVANGSAGSGPESFTAWTKAGLIIQFGQTADSAFDAWGKSEKLAWHANRISDTSGNYMDFVYTEDAGNGVHRLDRINYTGNGGVTPYASVRFEYEDRPDPVSGYAAGSPVASLQRLKYVKSYHGNDVARTYTLDYVTAPRNNRSQLSAITETGVGGERYQPLTFEYEDNVEGWDDGTAFLPPYYLADNSNSGRPAGSGFIDFDGDGRTDFVARRDGAGINYAYRNTGAGWTADSNYLLPYQLAENENADDQGSRFADLNGDGLIDYIVNKDDYGTGAGNDVNEAWLNMGPGVGWSSATQWRVPVPIYRDGTTNDHPQRGGKFLDVNGDGRVDFVAHLTNSSGTFVNLAVYLNNGSTWDGQHANYSSLPGFSGTNLPKYKPRFIDLNGDGLPDIAVRYEYGGDVLNRVWLNTGNGWSEDATAIAYRLPKTIANDTNPGPGAEFADVNGDGLPDLVWYRELSGGGQERGVAINTGAGWNVPGAGSDLYNRHAPPQPLARDGHVSAGSAFIDLNADGITDYVFSRQFSGQSAQKEIYYGNLKEWGYAGSGADHNLAHLLLQEGVNQPGADFVDFNGDGVVDVVWKRKHASGSPADFADLRLNRAKPINGRLKKVTNGFGVEASVTYSSLMDPSVYTKGSGGPADSVNLIGPMYVVSALTHDDGVGGTYQVTYAYAGLRAERVRGSLGFASMTVTDTRKNIVSTTAFKQGYPFIGMPEGSSTTHGGVNLSESSVTYGEKLLNGGATRFVFAQSSTETTRDLDGSLIGSVTTSVPTPSTDIDDYGNIWKLVVDSGGGFTKTTDSVYANVTTGGNWFLGRLTSSSVKSTAPDVDDITRKSAFTYYSSTTGLLEKEIVEPDDSTLTLKLTTTYGYDQFGNKTSVEVRGKSLTVDNNGNYIAGVDTWRTTTTQYDTQGRFPNWTENAAGHRENYTGYDQVRGLLTGMTGANLLPTSWGYDGFGRKTQENRADGTVTYIRYKWASAAAPAGAKYLVESESSGVPPTLAFYDKFGRVFATPAITGDGALVWQETQFDNQGRATATSNPHFAGATVYWTVNTGIDALDRPTQIQTPDDQNGTQTTSTTYAGLTITVTDAKNRVSKTVKNSQGWTLENIRNDGNPSAADYSRVAYTYDALGNLTQTDAAGVATTLAYDLRGRKTTMTDPDMGAWLYRYNIFGELIWQKDAKGQITTLAYDSLGRLTSRVEAEGTTTWTYDTAPNGGSTWKGKLHTVSSPGGYAETYLYDSFGRPSKLTRTIDSGTFDFDTAYDSLGRPLKTTYPTVNGGRFATRQVYNAFGYLKEIRSHLGSDDGKPNSQLEGRVFWEADHYDQSGRIDGEVLGNGLVNDRVYSAATGRLLAASVDKGRVTNAPYAIQQMVYTYDQVGNVLTRADQAVGRGESFAYDGLDRLLTHNVVTGVGGTVTVAYDQKGNITSKSDVGTYAYDPTKKHALTGVSGGPLGSQTYNYDANGNMLSGGGRSITWTSFNQAASIVKGSYSSTFSFGASHERVKQVSHLETTIYVGGLFEKVTPVGGGAVTEFKHYIMAPTGRVAVYTDRSNLVRDTRFFHTDGLGSITAVSDEKGVIVKRFAFDAWGKRLDPATGATITGATAASFRRGYTDHEQMDDLGLVHMNGRVYDPVLGRFISADPNVDGASDAQAYNRYSYVGNNPMNATDPSGYFKLKDILPALVAVVTTAVALVAITSGWGAVFSSNFFQTLGLVLKSGVTSGIAFSAGAAGGFSSGFSGSLLNGGSIGDAFRAGAIGGLVGGATALAAQGIGGFFGADNGTFAQWGGRTLAHATAGGLASEAQGGQFRHGFYSSAASVGFMHSSLGRGVMGNAHIAVRTATAATIGGTASALGGGKFANGAVTSAFQHLFNAEATRPLASQEEVFKGKMLIFAGKTGAGAGDAIPGAEVVPVTSAPSLLAAIEGRKDLATFDRIIIQGESNGEEIWFGTKMEYGLNVGLGRGGMGATSSILTTLSAKMNPNAALVVLACQAGTGFAPALAPAGFGHVVYAPMTKIGFAVENVFVKNSPILPGIYDNSGATAKFYKFPK